MSIALVTTSTSRAPFLVSRCFPWDICFTCLRKQTRERPAAHPLFLSPMLFTAVAGAAYEDDVEVITFITWIIPMKLTKPAAHRSG